MNAISFRKFTPCAPGLWLGLALPFALVGCLLTAPPPQPTPTGPTSAPAPRAPAPVSSAPAPRPLPRTGSTFADPPRPNISRPLPKSQGTISPSSARVGAQIAIFADFKTAAQTPKEVQCWFEGAGPVTPVSVRADRLVVQVPGGARTGNVRVTFRRRLLWSGGFTVQATTRPPVAAPTVDCKNPPSMMCCKAMTEACMACAREAQAKKAEWDAQCTAEPKDPEPKQIDCSRSPPRRACCKALTPECTECQALAREENRRWDEACLRR